MFLKIAQFSSRFSSSLHKIANIFVTLKFHVLISFRFGMPIMLIQVCILEKLRKLCTSYNITKFLHNLLSHLATRCSTDAMDLKIFQTLIAMLLKVHHFEGFSNWSNVDELVINNMSGCNCNSYKINNNLA